MSHKSQILEHLKNKGSITSWEAIENYGCTRLAVAIFELKKDGHIIGTEKIKQKNRDGKKVCFAKYVLNPEVIHAYNTVGYISRGEENANDREY